MKLLRSSAIVAFYTLASRVLGFVRDILMGSILGTVGPVEAFIVAFRFPNMFRRLVSEGAFAAAFVPLFSKRLEADGRDAAMVFADQVFSVLLTILFVFTVVVEIFMPQVLLVVAPGFAAERPELFDTAVLLTRLTLPYLMCMAIVAMMSGMLNSVYKFAAAAAAPILLNTILIVGLLFAGGWFETPAHMLAWAVALAGIAQYLWLGWACRRAGLDLRLRVPRLTPAVKRLLKVMVPGLIAGGMTQINILVGTIIGTFLTGVVSYVYYADRVYQFPLGMIGIAIGTALLPELSRTLERDGTAAMAVQNRAVELSMLLTVPAAAALAAIPLSIITVMFQHGRFTAEAAHLTAWALLAFAAGLPAFVLIKVLSPGFWARHDTRSPMIYAVISMVANMVLSPLLVWPLGVGYLGIPIATSVAAWINAGLLAVFLIRRGYWSVDARLARRLPRVTVAAAVMAAALIPAADALAGWSAGSLWQRIIGIVALVIGGMVIYGGLVLAIGGAEIADLKRLRPRGRKPAPAEAGE
jgi:putative peptidoglycan lipid II flippase